MKGLLRKMLPVAAPEISDDKDDVVDYSFAIEYHGPPVTYELPRAVPIDIKRIPTASVLLSASIPDKLSLPVVQPLLSVDPLKKEHLKEVTLGSDINTSPNSVIGFEQTSEEDRNCRLLSEISSSSSLGFSNSHDQSCEFSEVIDSSGALVFSNELVCSRELSSRISSSEILRISNSRDQSSEIGRSGVLEGSEDCKESVEYVNGGSPHDWGSIESGLNSQLLSPENSSSKVEDCGNISHRHAKKTAVVTFCDAETRHTDHEQSSSALSENMLERKEAETKGKKGSCYRCFKGNRFTEKEVCIVCDAKYCSNCVLRAMGSMPEGRKCVPCIGFPIDESKRKCLGKCSRILKRLLSELEIRQIMEAEKLCEANQLQPEHVYVNGHQLCQEELDFLQSCANPPPKLKPGRYWYDKVSGLWGKDGQKPYKVISAHLNVGGPIMPDASDGNTQVFINNREITKVELRMLQLAGVQCAGNPHFWVNEDGSYQEEGQKNIKGNLWNKAGMKLVCAVLSLPFPSKTASFNEEEVNELAARPLPDYIEKRTLQKLLLVGYKGSGSSTIFKQAKILYKAKPFSDDERQHIKLVIQTNVYHYLGILLEGRERFEDEFSSEQRKNQLLDESGSVGTSGEVDDKSPYSIGPRLKAFSDWLLKVMVSGNLEAIFPAATREYAPLVEELWKDAAIQATFSRRTELQMLPRTASYFLERIVDISRTDYDPSNSDILFAEGITSSNGLSCVDFSFPQSTNDGGNDAVDQNESLLRYQLIRVHAKGLGESCKWLEMFEDVRIVVFCVSLSDYDQFCDDGSGATTNKMLASRTLFENIITNPIFEQMDFHLVLNKFDLLEKKVEQIPLNKCEWFDDFNPLTSRYRSSKSINNASLAQQAFHYIAVKFKRHFSSLTGRKLYVSLVNGLEPDTVDETLRYAREILKWDEERAYFSSSEFSIYSNEASTSA
ncbi:Guanine nucleotide-binding protein subunit alpha [Thalictrum thalictroides]|uniref:Guanine nucleotide-binding protein subunit alpha n=1 Tax=Thalictrum thalictroides TaxID=46969 RepID=A0A7J6WTS6_THATH|nr:Guanine nucleotide-binding protein subunit alpha [Thalictrum thalictroides]